MRRAAFFIALGLLAAACDGEGPVPGVREPATGEVETPEDACWRMVECGALAVNRPNEDEDCGFCDWRSCVALLEGMGDDQQRIALACVEAAPCDELKTEGAPEDPDPPWCFQQGLPEPP